ncbi:nitroreductase [Nocardia farcinica]|uniref:nitroreductase n=1 Tax=Nocardia farcinica TaxID=37329 RepID=UPI000A397B3D|nr:nitroreductase [Nocardia farcinica]SUE28832.1 nitroreductase [Nocardia farcinica]
MTDRFDAAVLAPDDEATDALERILRSRWSCRAFAPEPVPRSEIARILDLARRSPSWCNTQPWHVHVTEGADTDRLRKALRAAVVAGPEAAPDIPFPESYEGVYRDRRRISGWQLYESLGIDKGDRVASGEQMLRNFDLFDAPHVAIVTTERALGAYGAVDCGIFVSNFVLAAHSRGVATIPQAALATQAPLLREQLGLPPERQVLLGISFGYPDPGHPVNGYRTDRQALAEVATFVGDGSGQD